MNGKTSSIPAHWIYCRLDAHVGLSDEALMVELDRYADEHIVGGRAALTDAHRELIVGEHHDAQALYSAVTTGRF